MAERFKLGWPSIEHNLGRSRTIADQEGIPGMQVTHESEANQYRYLERKFWGG